MKSVAIEQVVERLRLDNPWWASGEISPFHKAMQVRPYLDKIYPLVQEGTLRRAVVLMGPRRVGKTVMIHHVIDRLLEDGVPQQNVCYLSIDSPIYSHLYPEELLRTIREVARPLDSHPLYMCLDEIQYLADWERHLKDLVDTYKDVKFVASGSAAAALNMKSRESGAGRFTDFMLPPLSFYEFITMTGKGGLVDEEMRGEAEQPLLSSNDLGELNRQFLDYVNYGGYPELVFNESLRKEPSRFIKTDILDKVLLRDLPGLFGISDIQELYSFFTFVAFNSGQEVSLKALSEKSRGVEKHTVVKYLDYLEAAFLIRRIRRVDQNAKRFQRDNFFKLYLTNPSLRTALFSPLDAASEHIGNMVESVIYAQHFDQGHAAPYYARWRSGEVDMVMLDQAKFKPQWALEVKWSDRYIDKPNELRSLIGFCQQLGLDKAWCTTINRRGVRAHRGVEIRFVPAAIYAYTQGYISLRP